MARIPALNPDETTGKAKELLDGVKKKYGMVPKFSRTLANSPAALEGYLVLGGALAGGVLDAQTRERIALVVAQNNGCDYCLAAHSMIAKMAGLAEDQILASRDGKAGDPKAAAIVKFAVSLVKNRANVSDAEVAELRKTGVTDAELAEIVANVALNTFSNYFNHVAGTEVDFPAAAALAAK